MILAVLEGRCGLSFATAEVYLNVAGGYRLSDPAADLAVAAALVSAMSERPVPSEAVVLGEIAQALNMPPSTATLHVSALEERGLVHSEMQPGVRGLQKVCTRTYDMILVELPRAERPAEQMMTFSMPVGAYVDFQVTPTCGLAGATPAWVRTALRLAREGARQLAEDPEGAAQ